MEAKKELLPKRSPIVRVCLDHQLRIYVDVEREKWCFFQIEGSFTLGVGDVESTLSTKEPASLSPAFELFGKDMLRAVASVDGRLSLTIESGYRIIVGPGTKYEPWEFHGPDGEIVVSTPGGGLAVWGSR